MLRDSVMHRCPGGVFAVFARISVFLIGTSGLALCGKDSDADGFDLSGIIHSGMVFRDLILPMVSPGEGGKQVLKAESAEVGDPAHRLQIRGLELMIGERDSGFHLRAPGASFDLKTKRMEAGEGFLAEGWGARFEGVNLSGIVNDRRFEISGHFQIRVHGRGGAVVPTPRPPFPDEEGAFDRYFEPRDAVSLAKRMTAPRLLQEFSPHLHGFDRYWKTLSRGDLSASAIWWKPHWYLASWQGGGFDLSRKEVRMAGASALIGPGGFLSSEGGMVWRQEASINPDDSDAGGPATETRILGQGGVNVWMQAADDDVTWIRSERFEYVAGLGNVLQFEGGPVRFFRSGVLLRAEENWQFVRLFDGEKLVLSPGNWKTLDEDEWDFGAAP